MNLLYLIVLLPLIGFMLLAFSQGRWSENLSATIGVGSIGLSALVTVLVGIDFLNHGRVPFTKKFWTWIHVDNFNIGATLTLDKLAFAMLATVIGVGFLIHIFASWYMRGEEGYSRFFAYTNLFIASMVVLVLSDNLLLMYFGWEVVGFCSYLLIGFYYTNPNNGKSAIKAFIITRVGDVFLALATFILYNELGTLNFHDITQLVSVHSTSDNHILKWATLFLLGGAVGKSAQLPLQTWLVDAMVGPTPVSALIHAATMVTAGVYLIARTHSLFLMTSEVLHLVGILGALTLLLASISALVQTNIKRILAYSTMSQIGYMFLALGVHAWDAAIFHLINHALFKALLFLSSGLVILACNHEQNILKMGGLRKSIPLVYFYFLVGGSALSALPLITTGFYSKEEILFGVLKNGSISLIIAGLIGTFLTSIYIFRMIFIIFHGEEKIHARMRTGFIHHLPLILLLVLSTFIGVFITSPLATGVLQDTNNHYVKLDKMVLEIVSGTVNIVGLFIAIWLWISRRTILVSLANSTLGRFFSTCLVKSWGFDWLYNQIFIKPWLGIAKLLRHDPLSMMMNIPAFLLCLANKGLIMSANGYLRWYIASIAVGTVIVLILVL